MKRLRVGCIGAGFVATQHLQALGGIAEVQIVAIADPVAERAETTAGDWGARPYDDGLALLCSEELEAVWFCVPPFAHGALEAAALDRGLPFFVEKPIAVDLATAVHVAERVSAQRLMTAVGYHWRQLDVVQTVAGLLQDRPAHLALGYWLDRRPPAPWWSRRGHSGGQVIEQSTHIFDLARVLVGEVLSVRAVERTSTHEALPAADVPTVSMASLQFASGAVGTVASTCVLASRHRVGLHLLGDELVAELTEHSLSDHELRIVAGSSQHQQRSLMNPIEREDREFADALLGRVENVRVSYEEALRTHALAWAVDRSAREGIAMNFVNGMPNV